LFSFVFTQLCFGRAGLRSGSWFEYQEQRTEPALRMLFIAGLSGELSDRVTRITYSRCRNPSDAGHTNSHFGRWLAGSKHDRYKPPRFGNAFVILKGRPDGA
jgi:hypothetical protein